MEFKDDNPPPLEVKITEFNRHEHLDSVVGWLQTVHELATNCFLIFRSVRRVVSAVRRMTPASRASVRSSGEAHLPKRVEPQATLMTRAISALGTRKQGPWRQ